MSASIIVNSYPKEVTVRTRMVKIDVTLEAGMLPQNLAIRPNLANPNVVLYQDTTIPATAGSYYSLIGANRYNVYLRLNPGWQNAELSSNAIVLYDTVSNKESDPFYIAMSRNVWQSVTTGSDYGDADDFDGTVLNRDKWDVKTNQAAAGKLVASSRLTLSHPALANAYTRLESEIFDGYPVVGFRQVKELMREAHSGFLLKIEFFEETTDVSVANPVADGYIALGFNMAPTGVRPVMDAATGIRLLCASATGSIDRALLLPGAGVTTDYHDYELRFDGHKAEIWYQGALMTNGTLLILIPTPGARRFRVVLQALTDAAIAPALLNSVEIDRVDVAQDMALQVANREPLMATLVGGGDASAANQALQLAQGVSTAAAETAVPAANADTVLLAANPARRIFSILNDSDKILYLSYGGAASATSPRRVPVGFYWEDPSPHWLGAVNGYWDAGVTGNARICEQT